MRFRTKTTLGVAVALSAMLAVTGCSSGDSATESPTASGSAAATGTADVSAAQANIEQASQPINEFTPPGPAIDASSVAGKTVYFVPAQYAVPLFAAVGNSLTSALAEAGVNVQICDGKANPSNIADCMTQAINAQAGAVVTGSIPSELASVAFQQVQDAGIPLVNALTIPAGPGEPTKVGYITPDFIGFQQTMADYVIANSDAKANVLLLKATDTPATILWADQAAAYYAEACPDCKVTTVETSTGQLDKLPSLVSSAMITDSSIDWIHVEFDSLVQPTIQGLQSAPNADSVKLVSMDGTLPVMQLIQEGRDGMAADMGYNLDAFGWYTADQALRMMTGNPSVQNDLFPFSRLFTAENTGDLTLTAEAQGTGEWFGTADYQSGFKTLWGLN